MTSPSSPVDSIAKAMEGEIRRRAVDLVDTLVLERETNGQSKEFMDWAVFMTVQAFNEQRSRQAEAMKREMAEKDARIAALREALLSFEYACEQLAATRTHEIYTAMIDGGQTQELLELDNARRRARALIGGGNAED